MPTDLQMYGVKIIVDLLRTRRSARFGVIACWLILAIGGVLCANKFLDRLTADLPPVAGTPSKLAQDAYNKHFPAEPTSTAFLVKSRDQSKLLDFGGSTCKIGPPRVQQGLNGLDVSFSCTAVNHRALGGGCIVKADLTSKLHASIAAMHFLQAERLQSKIHKALSAKLVDFPNITSCPHKTGLSKDWLHFAASLGDKVRDKLPDYQNSVTSFSLIPKLSFSMPIEVPAFPHPLKMNVTLDLPAGEFWQLFEDKLLADHYSTSLLAVKSVSKTSEKLSDKETDRIVQGMIDIASEEKSLYARAISFELMLKTINRGISEIMSISEHTTLVALIILAAMVWNLRLLLITVLNLMTAILTAILFVYPYTLICVTPDIAPAMMLAVALAMSIDYSLFMLTRFQAEVAAGRSVPEAVVIVLRFPGRIIVVSGLTLTLCFLAMLVLPVAYIYSLGVVSAVTVLMVVLVALTLTPALLLSFPRFFSSNRAWGLSSDGCCCDGAALWKVSSQASDCEDSDSSCNQACEGVVADYGDFDNSCWPSFSAHVQKGAWLVACALVASMILVAVSSLPYFQLHMGLTPMLPANADATHTLLDLQTAFGVGTVMPTQLIVVPPEGATSTTKKRKHWLRQSCEALHDIATQVAPQLNAELPQFTAEAFVGPMILNGQCDGIDVGQGPAAQSKSEAVLVTIYYQIDPFSTEGGTWIQALREAVKAQSVQAVASWYVYGVAGAQLDVVNSTFARLPLLLAVMVTIIFLTIGLTFKSIVAPIRAIFCLSWMFVITIGVAIFTYQYGMLSVIHYEQVGQRQEGAMSWMSPMAACTILVGLGLDYDIFYSERVIEEWERGYDEKDAANRALGATANIISAAGVIMILAFSALLACQIPALNEIAFILVVGIIIDCFMSTKIIIPCVMALLGRMNFWPRIRRVHADKLQVRLLNEESTTEV